MCELIDWNYLINFQESDDEWQPKVTIPFLLDTPCLKREFPLDIVVWNLNEEKLPTVKKVVEYVLANFGKLFETAWTGFYQYMCSHSMDEDIKEHTLTEFYQEQIDFEDPYYTIRLEINSDYLSDGAARYHFVVSTTCDYRKWMISDDDIRLFMRDNRCEAANTNNDDTQILEGMDFSDLYTFGEAEKAAFASVYEKMAQEGFRFAEPFQK